MKIIYLAVQNDKYDPKRGKSYEESAFADNLRNMQGVELIEYPYDKILAVGKKAYNEGLEKLVESEKPDLVFAVMYTDELDLKTLDKIKTMTTTAGWFCDDHRRFDTYTKEYATHFSYPITTHVGAIEKYKKLGAALVLLSQWAASAKNIDEAVNLPKDDVGYKYSVSFVGQKNYYRGKWVEMLAARGIIVEAYGAGWERGRVSGAEMKDIFRTSRINLNFTVPQSGFGIESWGRLLLKRSVNRFVWNGWHFFANIRQWWQQRIPQIKARSFEITAVGGFCITGAVPGMELYFKENEEAVFYHSIDDLTQKIQYYLAHPKEREAIRDLGHERTKREHTYDLRFKKLFEQMHLL